MQLTSDQETAVKEVREWLSAEDKPIFRLFGYAGTGKTTIAKMLVEDVKGKVLFASYTGKAALVMQRNGMPASTLHSLLYLYNPPNRSVFKEMKTKTEKLEGEEKKKLEHKLHQYNSGSFEINHESELCNASLLVIDECSMVNEEMKSDILSFGVPVLVLGDPGQLPPIEGLGALTSVEPDVMMTQVMRQALDNPIIWMATEIRNSHMIPFGDYGESNVITKSDLDMEMVTTADQVITGTNKTRRAINSYYRGMKGYGGDYPNLKERLICLKNNRDIGVLNGLMGRVEEYPEDLGEHLSVNIKLENKEKLQRIRIHKVHFDEYKAPGVFERMSWWDKAAADHFDYAYAITCHKAQGSQWDYVIVNDEGFGRGKPSLRKCWLYTAITRAVDKITLVRK